MTEQGPYLDFPGRLVIVGFGCIGQGLLPLILRHIGISPAMITVVVADADGRPIAEQAGVRLLTHALRPENYRQVLEPLVGRGDFLLNVAVDVSSLALIDFARNRGALYLDTSIEPWRGAYDDPTLALAARTNYALREQALALRTDSPRQPTAVLTHGANPGLVSHFVKRALLDLAAETGLAVATPRQRTDWAELARRLGVRTIHIAERDTQVSELRRQAGEFVNTWSVDGFISEAQQPCELGWGSHERRLPRDGCHHMAAAMAAARKQPSICSRRDAPRACAAGRQAAVPFTDSPSRMANRSRSPTT
ncbi:MAG: Homospermidine synthase [Candidatus Accumulibacter sp. BA-94]|nr:MAG: Homospermidine synthase [Candidatus Accumulibacter sp. BA-94]